jgi:hypothetical protein
MRRVTSIPAVRRGAPLALVATVIVSLLATAAAGQQLILTRDTVETPILGSVDSEDLTPPDDPELVGPSIVAAPSSLTEAPSAVASAAPAAPASPTASPEIKYTRVAKPMLTGPRRVGIQAGHWLTTEAPPELWRLVAQTGTSWNGVKEVDINLDIANRVKAILVPKGIVVDVLPTTIPPGYLADAFVALHGDGDGSGERSGFKMAYVTRRTPYEQDLLLSIKDTYKKQTGLEYDAGSVSRSMLAYYAMSWQRYKWATNPHTPSVIMEMGYVSNDGDRELMTGHADVVAGAIASGIMRFLDDHPREKLFGQDLLVPALPAFGPVPAPSPRG